MHIIHVNWWCLCHVISLHAAVGKSKSRHFLAWTDDKVELLLKVRLGCFIFTAGSQVVTDQESSDCEWLVSRSLSFGRSWLKHSYLILRMFLDWTCLSVHYLQVTNSSRPRCNLVILIHGVFKHLFKNNIEPTTFWVCIIFTAQKCWPNVSHPCVQ